jgi:hypothetical protein
LLYFALFLRYFITFYLLLLLNFCAIFVSFSSHFSAPALPRPSALLLILFSPLSASVSVFASSISAPILTSVAAPPLQLQL